MAYFAASCTRRSSGEFFLSGESLVIRCVFEEDGHRWPLVLGEVQIEWGLRGGVRNLFIGVEVGCDGYGSCS